MIANAWQGFDFGLGNDIDMLRETTRSFSDDKIAPRADEIDKTNTFPRDLWPQMGARQHPARSYTSTGGRGVRSPLDGLQKAVSSDGRIRRPAGRPKQESKFDMLVVVNTMKSRTPIT